MIMKYLITFSMGPEGDTHSVLVTASNQDEARTKALKHMKRVVHYGIRAICGVDEELVD